MHGKKNHKLYYERNIFIENSVPESITYWRNILKTQEGRSWRMICSLHKPLSLVLLIPLKWKKRLNENTRTQNIRYLICKHCLESLNTIIHYEMYDCAIYEYRTDDLKLSKTTNEFMFRKLTESMFILNIHQKLHFRCRITVARTSLQNLQFNQIYH